MLPLRAALGGLSIWLLQTSTLGTPADVSSLEVSAPAPVAELDLGTLKGELRQIAWSPDAAALFVQTAEGRPPSEKLHFYTLRIAGVRPQERLRTRDPAEAQADAE